MPNKKWAGKQVLVVICFLVSSCSFYHREYKGEDPYDTTFLLRTVQVDDFGSWWNPQKAQETFDLVEDAAKNTNTYVVLFIHGWHHNADIENPRDPDDNYENFKKVLAKLAGKLATSENAETRRRLTGNPDFKLIGVYVGWRGRSLPGFLDYATMWWRKPAAERVGDGDVSEFIERLHRLYLRTNAISATTPDARKRFMGLVSIGHSFGGQVLMKSLARPIEYDLTERAPKLARTLGSPVQIPLRNRVPQRTPIDSYGDVNILINPALEAYQFAKIDGLYRQIAFPSNQSPQLVVFSADNDRPRQFYFPLARALTWPFRPWFRDEQQAQLYGQALGEYEPQRTHTLKLTLGVRDSVHDEDLFNTAEISRLDLTGQLTMSGVTLEPIAQRRVPNSPVAVVYTENKIIDGHNEIFRPEFVEFLTRYIELIEGKNLEVRKERSMQRFQARCERLDNLKQLCAASHMNPKKP